MPSATSTHVSGLLTLHASGNSLAGVALHAFGALSVLTLLSTLLGVGVVGNLVESEIRALPLLVHYAAGVLFAGATYALVAAGAPLLAGIPLETPIGALAAFVLLIWQMRIGRYEETAVFGLSVNALILWTAGIMVALRLLGSGAGGLAWLAAASAGALSAPLVRSGMAFGASWNEARRAPAAPQARRHGSRSGPGPAHDPHNIQAELDQLLEKIGRVGLRGLSRAERGRLERLRRMLAGSDARGEQR